MQTIPADEVLDIMEYRCRAAGCPGVEPEATTANSARGERFRVYVQDELAVLLRVARRLTGTSADAEDLVQETLIRAYRAIDRFDGRYPRAWLLTILRRTWLNMVRKQRPGPADDPDIFGSVPATGADGRTGAEERVLDGVLEAELEAGLRALSRAHREVVLLVDVDVLSYQEAADVLGIPTGTVMSRLHRARRRLRSHLEKAGFTPGRGTG